MLHLPGTMDLLKFIHSQSEAAIAAIDQIFVLSMLTAFTPVLNLPNQFTQLEETKRPRSSL
jgi:hypothetical protein